MRGHAIDTGERLQPHTPDDGTTPHPSARGCHLLPQGEKGKNDGIREEVSLRAIKSVIALQLQQAMKVQGITRAVMATEMETSRAQLNRVLDPEASNVTLETLSRAAGVLGRTLKVELI